MKIFEVIFPRSGVIPPPPPPKKQHKHSLKIMEDQKIEIVQDK